MTDSEIQLYESIKYHHWILGALVGDHIFPNKRRISGGGTVQRNKQIADFWIFGNSVFCGIEVKSTFGDDFDTAKSKQTRFQMMNLRKIERMGQRLLTGRGFLMIQFLESRDWFALRIGWVDEWIKQARSQRIPLAALQEEAASGSVLTMAVEKKEGWNTPVVDLMPLIANERES